MVDIKLLVDFTGKPPLCEISHRVECPCFFGPIITGKHQLFYDIMRKWQAMDAEITNYDEFDLDDFAVVFQPFILNYTFPQTTKGFTDFSILSSDCFHFSQKGHALGK